MEFVLHQNKQVTGIFGHTIDFKKGEPIYVPREMHEVVMSVGAIPSEELQEDPRRKDDAPTEQADRNAMVFAACEDLALKNRRDDFGANGLPNLEALEKALGWKATKKERDAMWTKLKSGETV